MSGGFYTPLTLSIYGERRGEYNVCSSVRRGVMEARVTIGSDVWRITIRLLPVLGLAYIVFIDSF